MPTWLTALLTVASILFGGGGLVAIIQAVTGRRARKAEVADRLSDSSLKWVQEFQEETQRARLDAAEARREVAEVRRELAECRHEAEALARDLRNLRGAIMAPAATLERLRALVGGGEVNGRL
ncbi:hypothetical protein [Dactylosporangium roseum]|uniref:hypothetical protein n=1 Tax=Dactylosporangium roseum TaxID=47989 RepID=UPI0031CFA301